MAAVALWTGHDMEAPASIEHAFFFSLPFSSQKGVAAVSAQSDLIVIHTYSPIATTAEGGEGGEMKETLMAMVHLHCTVLVLHDPGE